tara:strand:+ start:776 stop:1489 length:714 start_codon:yes stop_codon:yes gene_type:complete
MRLNKYLARCGIGSRRKCDEYILSNKIKINGRIVNDFSFQVDSEDYVQFKGKTLNFVEDNFFYILNKPKKYICSHKDTHGRKKIFDLIDSKVRLFSVGRLDYDTTGIILLTNNGDIANKLSHPKFKVEKKYYVESDKSLTKEILYKINKKGIRINNDRFKPKVNFEKKTKDNTFIWNVSLHEGKNREIRKIFEFYELKILRLHRYEYAGINIDNIKSGAYRKINKVEKKLLEASISN